MFPLSGCRHIEPPKAFNYVCNNRRWTLTRLLYMMTTNGRHGEARQSEDYDAQVSSSSSWMVWIPAAPWLAVSWPPIVWRSARHLTHPLCLRFVLIRRLANPGCHGRIHALTAHSSHTIRDVSAFTIAPKEVDSNNSCLLVLSINAYRIAAFSRPLTAIPYPFSSGCVCAYVQKFRV